MSTATCAYCGKPAVGIDLCHARHPVCETHLGVGHQVGEFPPSPAPKPAAKRGRRP